MVERTRERLVPLVGDDAALERVCVGRMDDLSRFEESSFDLVIALGVYHNAQSVEEWERSIAETARVLRPGGRVLVNQFTPETDLAGRGVHPVAGQVRVYEGLPGGRSVLVDAMDLDAAFARHGLQPVTRSETVRVDTETGRRVSINALYEKPR